MSAVTVVATALAVGSGSTQSRMDSAVEQTRIGPGCLSLAVPKDGSLGEPPVCHYDLTGHGEGAGGPGVC